MKKLTILLLCIGLISCDKEIPPVLPGFETSMVANCIIRPDTTIYVFLSNNLSVLKNEKAQSITDATIQLYEDDILLGILEETVLVPSDDAKDADPEIWEDLEGVYVMNYLPKVDKTYHIEISHNNYPMVSATTRIPDSTSDFEVSLSEPEIANVDEYGRPSFVNYTATIKIADAPGRNYYEIAVISELPDHLGYDDEDNAIVRYDLRQVDYITNNPLFRDSNNPAFFGDAGEVFSDDLFDENEFSIDISFGLSVGPVSQSWGSEGYVIHSAVQRFFIEVRYLSEEYYQYQYTSSLQKSITEDPFAEPVQVFNNIENGYGIFAGYNVELFEFSLEEFIPEE